MMVNGSEPAFEVGLFQTKVDHKAEDDRFYQVLMPFDSFYDVMRQDRYPSCANAHDRRWSYQAEYLIEVDGVATAG